MLIRSKLKDVTKGSCGAVAVGCRFGMASDNFTKKLESKERIKVERDMSTGLGKKRGKITSMTFTLDSGERITAANAKQLHDLTLNNIEVRSIMLDAYNPKFVTLYDKTMGAALKYLKASKSPKAVGETDEERQKKVNQAVSGVDNGNPKLITTTEDEDGNKRYSADGQEIPAEAVSDAEESGNRIEEAGKNGGTSGLLTKVANGAGIVGVAGSACMVYTTADYANGLAQTVKAAHAARFALAMVLTPGDMIKAGAADEGDTNYVGNNLSDIRPAGQVIDESGLNEETTDTNPPLIDEPEAELNAFSSPGYNIAAYGDAPDLSLRASQFMLAGGSMALLGGILSGVARAVNGGDPNPREVRKKCRVVNSPAVQLPSTAIGIMAGLGSFGITTALGIAGSVAIMMALPYLEAQIADMLAGDVFQDISGIDSGDAAFVGASVLFGTVAMYRGMKPLSAQEAQKTLAVNQQTVNSYNEVESYAARTDPFDITNRFSFLGSITDRLLPYAERSKASASVAMMNVASLIPQTFGSLLQPAQAASSYDPEYFEKCPNTALQPLGIGAGVFCNVHYGNTAEELLMDPVENANWMAANGDIEPDDETGKPKENDKSWNYAKFMKECARRTTGWGFADQNDENDGYNCVDPAKEEVNKHYRVFTMDLSLQESLDAEPTDNSDAIEDAYESGQTGEAGSNGWAFPTNPDNMVLGRYDSRDAGVEITGKTDLDAVGRSIFAAYKGTVVAAGPHQTLGNWIVIEHTVNNKKVSTVYGNVDDDGIIADVGDTVQAGDEIGVIGSATSGQRPKLWFEIWDGSPLTGGQKFDPTTILTDALKKKDEDAEAENA